MVGQGGSLADGWEYAAGVGAATQWIFVVAQGYLFVPLLREKTRRVCDAGAGARETGGSNRGHTVVRTRGDLRSRHAKDNGCAEEEEEEAAAEAATRPEEAARAHSLLLPLVVLALRPSLSD